MPFIIILIFTMAITGCGSEDSSTGGGSITYDGLWVGETEEDTITTAIPTYLLFDEETVYILREDEAQIGDYTMDANGLITMDTDIYSYAAPDIINQFFIGLDSTQNLSLSALIVTDEDMVINYNNATRAGRTTLLLDSGQTTSITTLTVAGGWTTTDATMQISSDGGFSGWNSATSCQWEGRLSKLNNSLLRLNIERENCNEFNVTNAEGVAFVDGESVLHFVALDNNDFLWMQFTEETTP